MKRFNEDLTGVATYASGLSTLAMKQDQKGNEDGVYENINGPGEDRRCIKSAYLKARSRGKIVINNFYSYTNTGQDQALDYNGER